jgi:hypothetical protein
MGPEHPPGRESRPAANRAASKSIDGDYKKSYPLLLSYREARVQRHRVAWFMAHVEPEPRPEPSSYGLSAEELYAEADRLTRIGWQAWEIRARLADPRSVAA